MQGLAPRRYPRTAPSVAEVVGFEELLREGVFENGP